MLPKFNAAKIGMLKRQGHAPKRTQVQAYDVKIHLLSRGVKKQDFEGLLWELFNQRAH